MQNNRSEIARLKEQFELECKSSYLGLNGLAQGVARHDFINNKLERMGSIHEKILGLMGEKQTAEFVVKTMDNP
jgi:hypothetical protein